MNVTFRDSFTEKFDNEMNNISEKQDIIIIVSNRVNLLNGETRNLRVTI